MKRMWQVVQCGGTEQMVVCPTLARWDLVGTGCTHSHTYAQVRGRALILQGGFRSFSYDKDGGRTSKTKVLQHKVHAENYPQIVENY